MTIHCDVTRIVQEAPVQDKGKEILRVTWETMEKLGLSRGRCDRD